MTCLISTFLLLSFAQVLYADDLFYPCQLVKQRSHRNVAHRRSVPMDADSAHSYDMLAVRLDYRVESSVTPMTGTATIRFRAARAMTLIEFNAEGLQVFGVNENDATLPFTQTNDTVLVTRPVQSGDTLEIWFVISAPVIDNHNDVGFHVAWNHAYTFSEPYGARRWLPCFDQPFDKVNEFEVAVNMPDNWSLAANGELTETSFPEPGRKREVYRHDYPIATYLMMLCAGDYARRTETVNGVHYRYFSFREDSLQAVYDWQRTPEMVAGFEPFFGAYPFEEYGMVQAAIFYGWGAMEHQTLTTYGYQLVDSLRTFEGIVAHELAHQWFGDAISPVDFRNMWLNEGFATYGHALWYEHASGDSAYDEVMQLFAEAYFEEDQTRLRYPVYDPPPDFLFGGAVYFKGAWILRMIREQFPLLNPQFSFESALTEYVNRFRYGNVSTEDFAAVMSEFVGVDVDWFFDQWVYQAGYPEVNIEMLPNWPGTGDFGLLVHQMQTAAPVFRFPLAVTLTGSTETDQDTLWVESAVDTFILDRAWAISNISLDNSQPVLMTLRDAAAPDPGPITAHSFRLADIYPNPFNSRAEISFELPRDALTKVAVYDITGRLVESLLDAEMISGNHVLSWNAVNQPSGVYLVAVESDGQREVAKAMLLK